MFPLVLFYRRFLVKMKISFYSSCQVLLFLKPEIKNRRFSTTQTKDLASWKGKGFRIEILIRKRLPFQ